MSLRESLARSKAKWRKRLNIGSEDTSSISPSIYDVLAVSTGTLVGLPIQPSAATSEPSNLMGVDRRPSGTTELPEKSRIAWSGLKVLLDVLETSTDAFGPLRSAINGISRCVDIYKGAFEERQDYQEVKEKIEGLLDDLAKHMANSMGPVLPLMTDSVKRLCSDLEAEVKIVENKLERKTGRRLLESTEDINDVLECYHRIQGHLGRLTLNANLSILDANMRVLKVVDEQAMVGIIILKQTSDIHPTKEARLASMAPSLSARYNSAEKDDIGRKGCAPGTRAPQISLLLEWTQDPAAGRTCWMNGMAGTGKPTIAYSVCTALDEASKLGASFFCSRIIPECRRAKHIIPSISYQLARFSFPFRCALVKVLESDPDAHTRALSIQYEKLLVEPLLQVQGSLPTDVIVVIDALDECENENAIGQILDLLLSPESALPIRFLVSSRPEMEIARRMASRVDEQGDMRLVLHDLDADSVKADIEAYMRHELKHIPLTEVQWPGLIDRCGVLFIYASTTCRYLEQSYNLDALDEAVGAIVGSTSTLMEDGDETTIDELYLTILTAAFNRPTMSQVGKRRIRVLLETVICAVEPLTLDSLAQLLDLGSTKQASGLLQPLRSVLNVVESTGLVTTLHASFPDFMFSSARSKAFHCRREARHAALAHACLMAINTAEPKFNICGLASSYILDVDVEDLNDRVRGAIQISLAYACRYWSTHLLLGEPQDELVDSVHTFFADRLLLWMEVMNLTQCICYGATIIQEAEQWCSTRTVPDELIALAHDASQFVSLYASNQISRSTPHIYVSMLPFWPHYRPISKVYMPRMTGMIQPTGTAIDRRHLSLVAIWRFHESPPTSMSLSADGTRIVVNTGPNIDVLDPSTGEIVHSLIEYIAIGLVVISADGSRIIFGSYDSCVYLWDTRNGGDNAELLIQHDLDDYSTPLAFSPDFLSVAFGLRNGDIYIYSLQRRELAHGPLKHKGMTNYPPSVAFSPDGSYLAFGSDRGTVHVWDAQDSCMDGQAFEGHTGPVYAVTYSPDGSRLVSASDDNTIRVWDPQTGQTILGPLRGNSCNIRSLTVSCNGAFIASGSADGTIRVYDAHTGQSALGPLIGHSEMIVSTIFSPDNARLFSFSEDRTVRVWNVQGLEVVNVPLPPPFLPSPIGSVRYSHTGLHIASGSGDGTIHIWDVETGEAILGPLVGHAKSVCSIDYSHNDAYIVSSSSDKTLRIWDASNGSDLHGPLEGHSEGVGCVRFSPNSLLVASGSWDGTVRIWDVETGQLLTTLLEGSNGPICSVNFSPDGRHIVSGGDGILQIIDRQTGEVVLGPLRAHESFVSSVEFSPNGLHILSSSWDESIQTWDVQTGQQILVCRDDSERSGWVRSAAFSSDGHFIVSGSRSHTVYVWDAHTGHLLLGPLGGHTDEVECVQFSPRGLHAVSCSKDRTIRVWDVSSIGNKGQEDAASSEDMAEKPSVDGKTAPFAWTLDSGWMVGEFQERLIWVPPDLQNVLRSFCGSVISHEGDLTLNFGGALIGEQWVGCYRV